MKTIQRLFTVFLLFWFQGSTACLVPFYEGLTPKSDELYRSLSESHLKGSSSSSIDAFRLMQLNADSDLNLNLWSRLTYAFVLLENDSIAKAENILSDSSLVRNASIPDWISGYYGLNWGFVYSYRGDYNSADKVLRKALELTGIEYRELRTLLNRLLAENLRYQGKLDQSMVKWYETLELAELLGDSSLITDAYLGRGVVRLLQNDLVKSEEDFGVFFRYNNNLGNLKNVAYYWSLIGLVEYQRDNYQRSIDYNVKSYDIRKQINDLKGQGESLNNLALGYMGLGNWNQALRYLQEAIELKTMANDLTQTTVILNNMGYCHMKLGNTETAFQLFEKALSKGKRNGQYGDVIRSYTYIIKLYKDLENFKSAFEYQAELVDLKDSLNAAEQDQAIRELQVRFDTEKKEQEIELLQKESTIITNRWLTLAMGLFLAIILGILFIDGQRRKHRHETELLKAEDGLKKAELKNLNDQLDYNQKKLALYTENLIRKNELVGHLETRLKESVAASVPESGKGKKIIEDFSGVRILTEEDWAEFKELFDRVHTGLLDRLLDTFSDLTLADQRLFLLMKLGLSTSQIANILGVSPDSVKKGRYRLKKKLRIQDETSLQEFVSSF